jgi:hypothetical protein
MSEPSVRLSAASLQHRELTPLFFLKGYMPGNVSMSYSNPYVAPPGTAYDIPNECEQTNFEYYNVNPTQYHSVAPAQRTGYEGTEMYAASSRAFVDNFAALSVRNPYESGVTGSADFKISVQRHHGPGVLDKEMATDYVRSCAPGAVPYILRVDILKGRGVPGKPPGPSNRALIVFSNADACRMAREGMFDKEVNGMTLVQGPSDDGPAEHGAPVPRAPPKEPRPKPEGTDQRTRKEKKKDRRKESDAQKKERKQLRTAEAGHPSGYGPGGGGPSGYAAPGAPGPASSAGRPVDDAADEKIGTDKGKEKESKVLVVDGSVYRKEKQAKVLVVDGTSPLHLKHKKDEKKRQK